MDGEVGFDGLRVGLQMVDPRVVTLLLRREDPRANTERTGGSADANPGGISPKTVFQPRATRDNCSWSPHPIAP